MERSTHTVVTVRETLWKFGDSDEAMLVTLEWFTISAKAWFDGESQRYKGWKAEPLSSTRLHVHRLTASA